VLLGHFQPIVSSETYQSVLNIWEKIRLNLQSQFNTFLFQRPSSLTSFRASEDPSSFEARHVLLEIAKPLSTGTIATLASRWRVRSPQECRWVMGYYASKGNIRFNLPWTRTNGLPVVSLRCLAGYPDSTVLKGVPSTSAVPSITLVPHQDGKSISW